MKKFEIKHIEEDKTVIDVATKEVIFSTKIDENLEQYVNRETMVLKVVNKVVEIWNKDINKCLFSIGTLDEYLLNEGECTQDEREIILESLYDYSVKGCVDKNGKQINIGNSINVDSTNEHYEFLGTVVFFQDDFIVVEDMEGDCFSVLPKDLELE